MTRLLVACGYFVVLAASSAASAQSIATLRVMTFNVWSGEGTAAGRDKLVEILETADADVIGLQEMGNAEGLAIAETLDYYYHQQSGGDIQVLSRYPIVGQSPANLGAEIELAPGQRVWLFNAHLAPYPYQPYDLRDGTLATEAEVIAAANSARGGQVTAYLTDMAGVLASSAPVFFTGDFNEPSHLDWTAAAAAATPRPFDLEVEYPASKRIVDAGFVDSFRAVRPDEVADPGYTWTPGYPPPVLSNNEVHDRIDIIYHHGAGVMALEAFTIGLDANLPSTDVGVPGFNADHRAVVVSYDLPGDCFLVADLNGDCLLDAADWSLYRSGQHADLSGLTAAEAYRRGDLNGDGANNHEDFVLFKRNFEQVRGDGAWAEMLSQTPEPSGVLLMMLGVALVGLSPRRVGAAPVGDL